MPGGRKRGQERERNQKDGPPNCPIILNNHATGTGTVHKKKKKKKLRKTRPRRKNVFWGYKVWAGVLKKNRKAKNL